MPSTARTVFWACTRGLTGLLLLLWLLMNLMVPWFARDLNALRVFGFPIGYWAAAEGALLVFLLIIAAYVRGMDKLEARCLEAMDCEAAAKPSRDVSL